MTKKPDEGGCWYCHDDTLPLLFSIEFDTYVHEHCLKKRMSGFMEAQIIAGELGISLLEQKSTEQ